VWHRDVNSLRNIMRVYISSIHGFDRDAALKRGQRKHVALDEDGVVV